MSVSAVPPRQLRWQSVTHNRLHHLLPPQVYGSDAAYEAPIMQEDGTEANETIDELSNLQAVSSARAH